jgi:hypothetical protein
MYETYSELGCPTQWLPALPIEDRLALLLRECGSPLLGMQPENSVDEPHVRDTFQWTPVLDSDEFQWAPVFDSDEEELDARRMASIREREKASARPWFVPPLRLSI